MTAAAERAAAKELLDAAEELTTGRWVAALAAYLRIVGYQVGDRVAIGGDPRFVIVGTIVGRVDHEAGYLVRPESGQAVFVRNDELRPIVADLLASAGNVVDSLELVAQPVDLTTCALCGRPERDVALAPPLADVFAARRPAVILAGSAYAGRAVEAFGSGARVVLPFEGARGIGDHLARAKELRETGSPATEGAKAAATELLEAAQTVGAAGSSDRWSKAVEVFLDVVGYRDGDRVYVSTSFERGEAGDPRFGKVATVTGRGAGTMAGHYLIRFDEADPESDPTLVPPRWLRPIVAELLTAAGEVLDSDLELEEAVAGPMICPVHAVEWLPGNRAYEPCSEDCRAGLVTPEAHIEATFEEHFGKSELETVALLAGDEVVSIGLDEQGRQKLRLRSELELPDEERTSVMREGLIFLADDVDVPACGSCGGERVVFRSGQMVPCPECIDEVPA